MYRYKLWMIDAQWQQMGTYWGGKGKFRKEYDEMIKHIPGTGKANDPVIEIIRCLTNFYYDRYNNAHSNSRSEEATKVRRFMKKHGAPKHLKFIISQFNSELEASCDWVISKCYELYKENNNE